MRWLKPTFWLAVLCRQVAAQRFWVSVCLALLGALAFHVSWRWALGMHAQALESSRESLTWLLHWIFNACQWFWPVWMLGCGVFGVWQRRQLQRQWQLLQQQTATGFDEVSWQDFETLVAQLFRRDGFEVVPQGGNHADGGVDIVVKRDGGTYLVQCKHWKSQRVGVKVVRELYGVVAAQGCDGGYVITSGFFTPEAVNFSQDIAMKLINGRQLSEILGHTSTLPK